MAVASSGSLIACVAVVGRKNEPLYFKCFTSSGAEETTKMQLTVFSALDVISEKLVDARTPVALQSGAKTGPSSGAPSTTATAAPPAVPAKPFLGLLTPVEDHKVFGYVTNGNIKLIVVIKDVLLHEDKVVQLFKSLHRLYTEAVCNPFAPLDGPITSPSFEMSVYKVVEAANSVIQYTGPLLF